MFKIVEISGPLVTAQKMDNISSPKILETVFVGHQKLLGEIVTVKDDKYKIQVYEDTTGLMIGEPVELKGELLSVELGPGLLTTIFDGIQRPLKDIDDVSPIFIQPGIHLPSLDQNKIWQFHPTVSKGEILLAGAKIGYVQETELLKHWIMLPPDVFGELVNIESGSFTLKDVVASVKTANEVIVEIKLSHRWPVKIARPIQKKLNPTRIFKTGQRVIDAMFPILLGSPVSTPGPFGAGKTFTQQQLAKWGDAQIVVYVGCGERGNEMTEMVKLFPTLTDPRTNQPLMDRTVLIANTSNMPIAAREASVYTGMTIAEYFRDMGYDVVLMADSTSRWAEAMREISARLGELPAEEGYPAYLSSRISAFYERAGVAKTLNNQEGSVTALGTVSPAGGDFSDPVTQASLKSTQVFLALDAKLAAKRHYPAINWITSYSLYEEQYSALMREKSFGDSYLTNRNLAKYLLAREGELQEMVKLIGLDGLSNEDRLVMEIGKSLREDFLQQNGFDKIDTYCSFEKMVAMLDTIIGVYKAILAGCQKTDDEYYVANVFSPKLRQALSDMKYLTDEKAVSELKEDLTAKINLAN